MKKKWDQLESEITDDRPSEEQRFWEEVCITIGLGVIMGTLFTLYGFPLIADLLQPLYSSGNPEHLLHITRSLWSSGAAWFLIFVTYPIMYYIIESRGLNIGAAIAVGATLGAVSVGLVFLLSGEMDIILATMSMNGFVCGIAGYTFAYMRLKQLNLR